MVCKCMINWEEKLATKRRGRSGRGEVRGRSVRGEVSKGRGQQGERSGGSVRQSLKLKVQSWFRLKNTNSALNWQNIAMHALYYQ